MRSRGEGMSRRQFLRLAGVTAGGISLAACTASDPGPTGQGPRGIKTVRFAMSGEVSTADTADPHLNTSQHDGRLMSAVYEQLAGYDDSLKAQPVLAESWEPNDTADVWTFKLRPNVTFHDASELTAGDVVYSFQRILDPATASPGAGSLGFLDPDAIEAVDDGTVRFTLSEPLADLPLALINRQAYIVKEGATGDDLRAVANGTGPFKLQEFTPGEDPTVFVRNDRYWESGLPKADAVELVSISEPASRVAALVRGQVDIIEDPPATELDRLGAGPDTTVVVEPKGNMEVIAMQIDVPPFDDLRVRQALKFAMDREAMLQLVAQGQGTLVNDLPISSILEYALPGSPRERDVAEARALLQAAGHGDGLDVTLAVSEVQARFVEIATAYKEMAAEVGVNVTLDIRPADTYWDEVWLQVPMFVSAWIARPVDSMLALLFLENAEWNETHWRRPDWDQRFAQARSTIDYGQRESMYRQLQTEIVDEGGYLVPYMVNTIGATRTAVTGWKPSGTPFENFATIELG
ncbi:MAG: ABC transporter substrate-binding protein [Acidimicrobiales bacterium]